MEIIIIFIIQSIHVQLFLYLHNKMKPTATNTRLSFFSLYKFAISKCSRFVIRWSKKRNAPCVQVSKNKDPNSSDSTKKEKKRKSKTLNIYQCLKELEGLFHLIVIIIIWTAFIVDSLADDKILFQNVCVCVCVSNGGLLTIVLQSHIIILHYIEQITGEDKIYTQFAIGSTMDEKNIIIFFLRNKKKNKETYYLMYGIKRLICLFLTLSQHNWPISHCGLSNRVIPSTKWFVLSCNVNKFWIPNCMAYQIRIDWNWLRDVRSFNTRLILLIISILNLTSENQPIKSNLLHFSRYCRLLQWRAKMSF